jgi:hypothetical protein
MVREDMVKNHLPGCWEPTRREFLSAAAGAVLGFVPAAGATQVPPPVQSTSQPAERAVLAAPWWIAASRNRSRVIDVRSNSVLHATVVDRIALGEMLDHGMQALTGAATSNDGWQAVLGSAKQIVVKFNSVGARAINTNEPMARLIVNRLTSAGYAADAITLVEAPAFLTKELGLRLQVRGWGASIPVGEGREALAQYLHDADAVINVPLLKTHQIAGMSGCMKNLSHALIRHPARYHANGCSPYVGQVIGSQEVSSRLKLNIVNALRVVVNGGPDAREEDIVGYGGVLLGFDPVAVDNVGLSILAVERQRRGLTGGGEIRYLASAARMGLGRWRAADIDRVALEMDR